MRVEHRISVAAPPETIFQIYADVENWHSWDPDTKSASIDGAFEVGTRGRITPPKGKTLPMLLTEVEPDRLFTVESKIPLFRILFEHELRTLPAGTEITHRVTFSGPLAIILGPMLTKQLNAGLPVTLSKLKALAEQVSPSPLIPAPEGNSAR